MKIISTRVIRKFDEEDWERFYRGINIPAGIILDHLLQVEAGQADRMEAGSLLSKLAHKSNEMEKSK